LLSLIQFHSFELIIQFVGSGIFKSKNPEKRAASIVKAVTNYNDPKILAKLLVMLI